MSVFNRTNSIDGEAPTQAALLYIQMELCDSTLRQWLDERNLEGCVDVRDDFKIFKNENWFHILQTYREWIDRSESSLLG